MNANGKSIAREISDDTWKFLKANKILIIIPFLSIIINLAMFYVLLIANETNFYLGVVILYFFANLVGIFFNSVIVAYIKFYNEQKVQNVSQAIQFSLSKIDRIIGWALFQALVGYIFAALSSNKILELFSIAAEVAWSFVTYFVIPIIIIEDKTVSEAIAESKRIIKLYWMESLKGEFMLSMFFLIIFLVLGVTFLGVVSSNYSYLAKYIFISGGVILFISLVVNSALMQIYNTKLYMYLKENGVR